MISPFVLNQSFISKSFWSKFVMQSNSKVDKMNTALMLIYSILVLLLWIFLSLFLTKLWFNSHDSKHICVTCCLDLLITAHHITEKLILPFATIKLPFLKYFVMIWQIWHKLCCIDLFIFQTPKALPIWFILSKILVHVLPGLTKYNLLNNILHLVKMTSQNCIPIFMYAWKLIWY